LWFEKDVPAKKSSFLAPGKGINKEAPLRPGFLLTADDNLEKMGKEIPGPILFPTPSRWGSKAVGNALRGVPGGSPNTTERVP
jgi:hypothetical protein